jgi:hypothetical protein
MSDTFEATTDNVVAGSLYTVLWFTLSVSVTAGILWGGGFFVVAFGVAFVIALLGSLIGAVLVGAPLALLGNYLLSRSSSVRLRGVSAVLAGLLTGCVASVVICVYTGSWDAETLAYLSVLVVFAALSSLAGWYSALRRSRRIAVRAADPRFNEAD